MPMTPFRMSDMFVSPGVVRFLAAVITTPSGATEITYPDPTTGGGEVVSASIQPGTVNYGVENGIERFTSNIAVLLLDDPASLNSGQGCKKDDAFWWSLDPERRYVAVNDAIRGSWTWRVECVARQ